MGPAFVCFRRKKVTAKPFQPFLHDIFFSWSLLRPSDRMFREVEKQAIITCCKVGNVWRLFEIIHIHTCLLTSFLPPYLLPSLPPSLTYSLIYLLTYLVTYLLTYFTLLTYLLTYLLTPWSRVLLEKLTGSQLVKKFSAFYGTRRFITASTSARHLSLS